MVIKTGSFPRYGVGWTDARGVYAVGDGGSGGGAGETYITTAIGNGGSGSSGYVTISWVPDEPIGDPSTDPSEIPASVYIIPAPRDREEC